MTILRIIAMATYQSGCIIVSVFLVHCM